ILGASEEVSSDLLSRFEAGREAVAKEVAEHPTRNVNAERKNDAEDGNAESENARIMQEARAASQTVIHLPKSKSGDEKVLLVGQDGNVTINRGPHYMSVEANNVL
ncbi:hypothetical protein AAVH_41045, partial [Aphelenchoides avenae]